MLERHVHLSLQDLVGGQFWENKPTGWMAKVHMLDHRDEMLNSYKMMWKT